MRLTDCGDETDMNRRATTRAGFWSRPLGAITRTRDDGLLDGRGSGVLALLILIVLVAPRVAAESIVFSKHNLSVTGPGAVRATSEEQICIFCHTPHGGRTEAPLWNRRDSTAAYIPYNSPTLKAAVGQPTGASKLCLSCHDGTVAMGDLVSEETIVQLTGSGVMPPGPGLIGTDLRDDHPISFNYFDSLAQAGGELTAPATWDARVKLEVDGELQCTTCHDPHDNEWGQFLVMPNQEAMLCRQCHNQPLFPQTPHAESPQVWNGQGEDPWPHTEFPDVRANACMNCHMSHHAGGFEGLLTRAREEETCFACHNGNVARFNLKAVFQKPYRHPVEAFHGVHEAGESPLEAAGHVECADCHNPHQAARAEAQPPFVMGVLRGVTGVDMNGAPVREAVYEYQICFKCHAGEGTSGFGSIERQINSSNVMQEFNPASPSYHPVVAAGRNPDVPSLISPLTPASLIYCSDCHGNDGAQESVVGSAGPHGSNYEFLLARQYRTGDDVAESPTAYALCYGCHSRESLLADESFSGHRRHIVEERISCSVCHDPHGIDFGEANPMNHAHLINFDTSVVEPDPLTGRLEYRSAGPRMGECYLSCHGVAHSPRSY